MAAAETRRGEKIGDAGSSGREPAASEFSKDCAFKFARGRGEPFIMGG